MSDDTKRQNVSEVVVDELRLALATCGAITLVVYESGVCHELERMVRQYRKGEGKWFEIFRDFGMRPVIDVLTGASAGGINSVFLGSCLVSGNEFSAFRDIWVNDLDALAMRHKRGGTPRALLNTQALFDRAKGQLIVNAKRAAEIRTKDVQTPEEEAVATTDLDLRLCLTDFAGNCIGTVDALGHRLDTDTKSHIERFTHVELSDPAAIEGPAAAARATSAFPGLFDPVQIRKRWFVDGGLWNNQPIDQALSAIRDRPAYGRTHRAVMFIEPNPSRNEATGDIERPAPALFENVGIIPGIGMKGSILPALEGLLNVNRRLDYFEILVEGLKGQAQALGKVELDHARRELLGEDVGQKGMTLLNKIRVERTLLDGDPRRIQLYRSLLAQFVVIDDGTGLTYEKQLMKAMLDRLRALDELDLRLRAARREIKEYNDELKDNPTPDRLTVREAKRNRYADLQMVMEALEKALGGRPRPFEPVRFSVEFDTFAMAAIDWIQSKGGVNQGSEGLAVFKEETDLFAAVQRHSNGEASFPEIVNPVDSSGPEPNDTDAWRHVLAGISDLEAKQRIDLVRISPNDVDNHHLIGAKIGEHETAARVKLASDGLGHVQGLFNEDWRRNDYVWGRLDAAEILLRTVQRFGNEVDRHMSDDAYQSLLVQLQSEILAEESMASEKTKGLKVRAFESGTDDEAAIKENSRLIGFGREKLDSLGSVVLAEKTEVLVSAASAAMIGSRSILPRLLGQPVGRVAQWMRIYVVGRRGISKVASFWPFKSRPR